MSNISNAGTTRTGARSHADGPHRGTPGTAPAAEGVEPRQGRAAARRRRAARRPDALSRLLPQALVVAFLAGGSTAYLAGGKAVQLSVDGRPRALHTFAGSVEELLQRQGVEVGDHDIVAPDPARRCRTATPSPSASAARSRSPSTAGRGGSGPRPTPSTAPCASWACARTAPTCPPPAARPSGGTGWNWTSAPNAR